MSCRRGLLGRAAIGNEGCSTSCRCVRTALCVACLEGEVGGSDGNQELTGEIHNL